MGPPPRKGHRITICGASLLMYIVVVTKMGPNIVSHATSIMSSAPRLETRSRNRKRRRILHGRLIDRHAHGAVDAGQGRNAFLDHFEHILTNNASLVDGAPDVNFAALYLRGGKLLCRKSQMNHLSRARYFVQMLRRGLRQDESLRGGADLPILIKHDDSNGCYPATGRDKYGFPRLTWSMPANVTRHNNHQENAPWCFAIGMPSYKMWRDLNRRGRTQHYQSDDNAQHPWSQKLRKAVWRGSTTSNKALYGHLPPQDTPRSQLVKASLERPDLIDAGFHKLGGKYNDDAAIRVLLKDAIPLEEMTKYRAIIDIDGNNWSARFGTLLCTKSVVIKIAPDFVEPFYHELEPGVHYIPASLGNLIQVVEYVMDGDNDAEMQGIVSKANKWCYDSISAERLAASAVAALEAYRDALNAYSNNRLTRSLVPGDVVDLVECKV